jgi:hypothetical protein
MTLRPLPLALLAALAACTSDPSPSRPPPPPTAVVAAITVADPGGRSGPFRIADLPRLDVEVRWTGAEPGTHAVRVDVLGPRGTLHAQLRGTAEVGADGAGRLARALEVQGTTIEDYQQAGVWTFSAALDDGPPLATTSVTLASEGGP